MAQFLVSLLPTSSAQSEKSVTVATDASPSSDVLRASPVGGSAGVSGSDLFDASGSPVTFRIRLRNVLLQVILRLTTNAPSTSSSPHGGNVISAQSVNTVFTVACRPVLSQSRDCRRSYKNYETCLRKLLFVKNLKVPFLCY